MRQADRHERRRNDMTPPCEIADKMPTVAGTLFVPIAVAVTCASISLEGRRIAWALFGIGFAISGLFTCLPARHSSPGPMQDAILAELGRRWIVIQTRARACRQFARCLYC